jgi:predicted RNA binding protein YcfA (HicA-like mRNA interferase family)
MKKDGHPNLLSVPVHGNSTIRRGTLKGLVARSGATMDEVISAEKD